MIAIIQDSDNISVFIIAARKNVVLIDLMIL